MTDLSRPWRARAVVAWLLCAAGTLVAAQDAAPPRAGDFIVAVVNQELVTAGEIEQRLQRVRENASRSGQTLPPPEQLRQQILDGLIEERVVVTHARDSGARVEDVELDRAVQNVAAQNQLSPEQLRQRLRDEGIDYALFRSNLRDQILIERVREREVYQRIRVTDAEIDAAVDRQRAEAQADAEINLAQILVTVPEGASDEQVAERRARAQAALQRVQGGAPFDAVAREVSEDGNRERGGEIGLRPVSRLPDLFVDTVRGLAAGQVAAAPVRSGAGFHVLKVLERREAPAMRVTQSRVRHILLRPSERLSREVAARRLQEFRRQIEAGRRSFEEVAREVSEDGSAAAGGDLGWASPGGFVPEFEEAMNQLAPGAISPPVVSRFGVHLIQVLERRQISLDTKALREQARSVLREQKFEVAYGEWLRDLRSRAYIEMREPPM